MGALVVRLSHRPLLLLRSMGEMLMACLLVMLCSMVAFSATSFDVYREEVNRAVQSLEALPQWKKVERAPDYERRASATLQSIAESLLPMQSIEWNGTTVTIDNKWLAEALTRYEQIPASDDASREAELAQLTERLKAVGERLSEMQTVDAGRAGKDEEKKKMEGILRRPEYNQQQDEGGALARLWRRFMEWLRNLFPRAEGLEPSRSGPLSGIAQLLVVSLALAVIVYIFWKFVPIFRSNRGRRVPERSEARVVLGERLEPDQTSADLLTEAEALARSGDLRAAIRKGYIALLCELGDRKIIGLAQHKTNRDYLRAVRPIEPLYQQMQQLTQSFENHWYGLEPATENDWNNFRSGFQRAVASQ